MFSWALKVNLSYNYQLDDAVINVEAAGGFY